MSLATPALTPGTQLGRYQIVRSLGRGGAGEVYLARAPGPEGFEKTFALKILHPAAGARAALVDEAKMLMSLHHSNVVQVFELGREGELDFVIMEFVDGLPLADVIDRGKAIGARLPVSLALYVGAEVCKALHFVHNRTDESGRPLGLVHRDISPNNILISWRGEVKVADFGIAKAMVDRPAGETEPGVVKGKLGYMAPEQASGGVALDGRTDIYATALSMFEAITDRNPLLGGSERETYQRCLRPSLPAASFLRPDVPADVDAFLTRGLAPARSGRIASAAEMRREIENLAAFREQSTPDMALAEHMTRLRDVKPGVTLALDAAAHAALAGAAPTPASTPATALVARSQGGTRKSRLVGAAVLLVAAALAVRAAVKHPQPISPAVVEAPALTPRALSLAPAPPRNPAPSAAVAPAPATLPTSISPPAPTAPIDREAPPRAPGGTRRARAAAPTAAPTIAAGTATLRVNVDPWAEVIFDGKSLGNVPRRVEVPAGHHTLTLRNPELHLEKSVKLDLPAGETKTISAWPP